MDRPPTKQDLREGSRTFGVMARKMPDGHPLGEWGFMSDQGGGGCSAAELAGWTDLRPVDE